MNSAPTDRTAIARYRIDAPGSRFTVQAFAAGLLSAFAHSPTFAVRGLSGEVRLPGGHVDHLELELTVDANSLALEDRVSASDRTEIERRMWDEVFETSAYPQIEFRGEGGKVSATGAGQYRLFIGGKLTLHGVTRDYGTDVEMILFEDGLRLRGGGRLSMSEYRIRPVTAVGGTIKLKDDVRLLFDLGALPEGS
jgi:polyisoprenoid-binding protein YceI